MSGLSEYLIGKRDAVLAQREQIAAGNVRPYRCHRHVRPSRR